MSAKRTTKNGKTVKSSGFFDHMAGWTGDVSSRAPFFAFCVLLVVVWLVQGAVTVVFRGFHAFLDDKYQLEINTTTTIITFLLVALLQNTQARSTAALQHKLDALLEANAEIIDNTDDVDESGETARQLRKMAGVEMEASK